MLIVLTMVRTVLDIVNTRDKKPKVANSPWLPEEKIMFGLNLNKLAKLGNAISKSETVTHSLTKNLKNLKPYRG